MRVRGLACRVLTAAVIGLLLQGVSRAAEGYTFQVVDPDGVYFGEGESPKTPAVIVADTVWAEIPEYKKIVEEELTDEDPRYHLLLKKATERFEQALEKLARRDGYDMIAEQGAIEVKGDKQKEIPDETEDMVELVSRDS